MLQYDYITVVSDTDWKLVAIIPNSSSKNPKNSETPKIDPQIIIPEHPEHPETNQNNPSIEPIITESTNGQVSFSLTGLETIPTIRLTSRNDRSNRRSIHSSNRVSERLVLQK
jgi:hypothetical protein